jgi:hypothetical protein
MHFKLVVVRAFGAYAKGDTTTNSEKIAEILAGENSHYVVRVAVKGN